jgi:hypothetical protein
MRRAARLELGKIRGCLLRENSYLSVPEGKRSDFCCFASLESWLFEVKNNKSL